MQHKNPIARLLQLLPREIATEKKRAIDQDLTAIGKVEHFRQRVTRTGWNMGSTQVACVEVLMRHLDLTMGFFTGTDEERARQIQRIVEDYYKQALAE